MFAFSHNSISRAGAIRCISHVRNLVIDGTNWDSDEYREINSDAIRHYYTLFIEFASHHDFIDGCAFENVIEFDNAIEMVKSHEVLNWNVSDFANHFAFDIRAMHHFNSLSFNRIFESAHRREECEFCNDEFDACCYSTADAMNAFEMNLAAHEFKLFIR